MYKKKKERSSSREKNSERYGSRDREDRKFPPAKRIAKFRLPKGTKIDYKDVALLQRYVSDRGKIISRRISGFTAKDQRALVTAISRARYLALLITGKRK